MSKIYRSQNCVKGSDFIAAIVVKKTHIALWFYDNYSGLGQGFRSSWI